MAETKKFAHIAWTIYDLDGFVPEELTDEEREELMIEMSRPLQDRLVEVGYEIIEQLMIEKFGELDDDD